VLTGFALAGRIPQVDLPVVVGSGQYVTFRAERHCIDGPASWISNHRDQCGMA